MIVIVQHNPGDQFVIKVANEASKKITSFSPQGLVNLAWAFACFQKYNKNLMDLICREVESKVSSYCVCVCGRTLCFSLLRYN